MKVFAAAAVALLALVSACRPRECDQVCVLNEPDAGCAYYSPLCTSHCGAQLCEADSTAAERPPDGCRREPRFFCD